MEKYNYLEAVKDSVKDYIINNIDLSSFDDRDELEQYLNDELFIDDSVTGNASGSYTFNSWKAEEYLCHNLDLLQEAMLEFGINVRDFQGAEWADVTIRCYLLGQAISEVLNEIY
ncbi:MAG: hypothetical protein ACI392_06605 [Paludibacteraceae bacterium]